MAMPSIVAPVVHAGITIEKQNPMAQSVEVPSDGNDIRILRADEYKQAAACLAEAFSNDVVVRYPIDTPDRAHWSEEDKLKLHLEALEYITYAHCVKGMVTTIGPNYDCVALWYVVLQSLLNDTSHISFCIGCLLARTWTTDGRSFEAVCGV